MHNLMQDFELRSNTIIDHAAKYHKNRKVISRSIEGPIHETTYAEIQVRAKKVAQSLERLGLQKHDTIGVMAWNTYRHLEVWYGIPGMGGVIHTLNPRLFADQLIYIVNHADDKALMVDFDLLPVIENGLVEARGHRACDRDDRPRSYANKRGYPQTCFAMKNCWTPKMATTLGRKATRRMLAGSVTPLAPPATPKVWSTPTAPTSFMHWSQASQTLWV